MNTKVGKIGIRKESDKSYRYLLVLRSGVYTSEKIASLELCWQTAKAHSEALWTRKADLH